MRKRLRRGKDVGGEHDDEGQDNGSGTHAVFAKGLSRYECEGHSERRGNQGQFAVQTLHQQA